MLGGNRLDKIETFTYLVSIVNNHGGNAADVKARTGKARVAFLQLKKNTWSARAIATQKQVQDLQLQREIYHIVWVRNMEDNQENHKKSPNLHEQLPQTHSDTVARNTQNAEL